MLRSIAHHRKPETGEVPAKVMPNYRNDAVINFDNSMRLDAITKQIGFTLWQLQELERVTAQYFVLVTQARRGMGLSAGNALVEKAERKTFGATVRKISKAGLLADDLEYRLTKLLVDRNWLVHSSRATNRNAIYHDGEMQQLLDRLEVIADESLALLREIALLVENYVKEQGVTTEFIEKASNELLNQWRSADEI